jgi:hypothetical protein
MMRYLLLILALALTLAGRASAEHFDITLRVESPEGSATAGWDTSPPEGGVNPRPVAHARAGQEIRVEWSMRSAFPHGDMKNVTVHFYVVAEEAVGQKKLPPGSANHLVDTSFTMDFHPDYAGKGTVRFRVPKPGNYLVHVGSEGTQREHGHEHFSAVDLTVE